ncbi:MAG: alpha-amylase family glycosyl hydrolase [Candidatus Didemnitutus sp.]|nr:alpha-amylase family glycosyl hydrolase [Candidatus Didemnitutus sp.]
MNLLSLSRLSFALAASALCFAPLSLRAVEPHLVCADQTAVGMPDWVRSGVVYEINVRQYSAAGNFAAVTADLPRLRALGVDILWLMPIHPIGEVNRKGPLGSYYAVRDYLGINPEFGTKDDFRAFMTAAHSQGFRVILDWVGNHTAWDNPLAADHPDYYLRDDAGTYQPPTGFDWTDVIQLDFSNPAVLDYQTMALTYWVKEFGVDGYRCDYATGVPTTFWNELTARLRRVRADLFFLSESDLPQHQLHAFNASYGFDMMHAINAVGAGTKGVSHLDDTLTRSRVRLPAGGALMYYTSNHDENSWQGTEFERLGAGTAAFAVLSFMLDGIPLIYNGQEIGLDRRLEFFERDPIIWPGTGHALTPFYQILVHLRRTHPALRTGAPMRRIDTTGQESIYALLRGQAGSRIVTLLNLTGKEALADAYDPALAGRWRDAFTGEEVTLAATVPLELKAWQYRVLVSLE